MVFTLFFYSIQPLFRLALGITQSMKKIILLFIVLFSAMSEYAQPGIVAVNMPVHSSPDNADIISGNISDWVDNIEATTASPDSSGPYALIAGGSKGIGYGMAEALAKRGYNLILVARGMDTLIKAKNILESAYHIHVDILAYDLSKEETAGDIAKWCTKRNIHLKMLCNVAGMGGSNDYLSLPLDSLRYMTRLNVESCMALTLTLLPLLEKNAPSSVLNVASMAGLAPIPAKNLYSATKSAVVFFSYSLRYQLKKKHISVSCLCPGPVFTRPEIIKTTKEKLGWFGMKMALGPHKVGEVAVHKTLKKRMIIVPGTLARITSDILRVLPRRISASLYNKVGS